MAQIYFARRRAKWLTFQLRLTYSLIPQRKGRTGPYHGDRYALFEEAVNDVYLSLQKQPKSAVYERVLGHVYRVNASLPSDLQIRCPARSTIYRWIDGLRQDIVDGARLGAEAARAKYRQVQGGLNVGGILERIEIDHTAIDLIVIDAVTALPIGRPWLSLATDKASRMIMGFYLSFNAPSSHSVLQCLRRAIRVSAVEAGDHLPKRIAPYFECKRRSPEEVVRVANCRLSSFSKWIRPYCAPSRFRNATGQISAWTEESQPCHHSHTLRLITTRSARKNKETALNDRFFDTARHVALWGACALAICATSAHAGTYPDKAITWVNPYAAGTASDVTARAFAEEFGKVVKQPVIIMNKPGAGGVIAAKYVAAAAPDGYTLFVGAIGTQVFNPVIYQSVGYDPLKDFAPISRMVSFPNVLVVSPELGVNTLPELIALAKSRAVTKPLSFGTAGNGTTSHIASAQLERLGGLKLLGVNFKGTPAAMNELLAGRIDMVFGNINIVLPQIRAGKLKAIAIASGTRYPQLPDTPTFTEVGMPQMEMSVWSGLLAPTGTPPEVIKYLNDAVNTVASRNVLQSVYEGVGATLEVDRSSEAFDGVIRADTEKWTPILKSMGVRAE